jgi:hypothetical protein
LPAKTPQVRVTINGVVVPGVIALTVDMVGHYAANRFCVTFAIGTSPFYGYLDFLSFGNASITIEVETEPFSYSTLLIGVVDNTSVDLIKCTAILTGRDLAAALIETEVTETYVNLTASQVAQNIAEKHDLVPNISSTEELIGQYYELDHARSILGLNSRSMTEWNLLTDLAILEDYILYIDNDTLYFGAWPAQQQALFTVDDFSELKIDDSGALPASTTVSSWNTKLKAVTSATTGGGVGRTIVRPNLSLSQATSIAQTQLNAAARHKRVLRAVMPGDLVIRPGFGFTLVDTALGEDQPYIVTSVVKLIGTAHGFVQKVVAYAAG